jgi:hypothetical protein
MAAKERPIDPVVIDIRAPHLDQVTLFEQVDLILDGLLSKQTWDNWQQQYDIKREDKGVNDRLGDLLRAQELDEGWSPDVDPADFFTRSYDKTDTGLTVTLKPRSNLLLEALAGTGYAERQEKSTKIVKKVVSAVFFWLPPAGKAKIQEATDKGLQDIDATNAARALAFVLQKKATTLFEYMSEARGQFDYLNEEEPAQEENAGAAIPPDETEQADAPAYAEGDTEDEEPELPVYFVEAVEELPEGAIQVRPRKSTP